MLKKKIKILENKLEKIRDEAASVIYLNDSSDFLPSLYAIFRMCGYKNDDLEEIARKYFRKLDEKQDRILKKKKK